MGMSKALSEKVMVAKSRNLNGSGTTFCGTRYGNVMASRGSVIPLFIEQIKKGEPITITDPNMTRFNITLADGVKMVLHALEHAWGGELFVPKIPSYRITDLAQAIGPDCEHPVIGIRPGEKIHEEMITSSDSFSTYDIGKYYVILPQMPNWRLSDYIAHFGANLVPSGFNYSSGANTEFLSVDQLRTLIDTNVKC